MLTPEQKAVELNKFRPEDVALARKYLYELCQGNKPTSMQIPPDAHDWDMVISRVIDKAEKYDELCEVLKPLIDEEIATAYSHALHRMKGHAIHIKPQCMETSVEKITLAANTMTKIKEMMNNGDTPRHKD